MFSRKPGMIWLLRDMCEALEVPQPRWPYVIGSTDPSSKVRDVKQLIQATQGIVGNPVLAYATASYTRMSEMYQHHQDDWSNYVKIVFGYHSTVTKTKIDSALACPATNGTGVTCTDCRRCFGPGR